MMKKKAELIAPCGINCALCMAYQREKDKCMGCRSGRLVHRSCARCVIANCHELKKMKKKFCIYCKKFPCRRLKQLDKRYKLKYHTSVFENLEYVKTKGLRAFADMDAARWTCAKCGVLMCMHRPHDCGVKQGKKKNDKSCGLT